MSDGFITQIVCNCGWSISVHGSPTSPGLEVRRQAVNGFRQLHGTCRERPCQNDLISCRHPLERHSPTSTGVTCCFDCVGTYDKLNIEEHEFVEVWE